MKKKSKKDKGFRKYAIIMTAVLIIGLAVFYSYSADQAKLRGYEFGNNLQMIQDDLKKLQTEFESKVTMWKENELNREEFLVSAQTQLESDKQLVEWIKTGDDSARVRSDSLLQESFEYEMAALASYNLAKGQSGT